MVPDDLTDQPSTEALTSSRDWRDPDAEPVGDTATRWSVACEVLGGDGTAWLATVGADGRPHLVPLLAVVVDGVPHLCASSRSRKVRDLAHDGRCVLGTGGTPFDVVVEGRAAQVTDAGALARVAEAYRTTYGWEPEVRGGGLWADGAPTAGPPPYAVFRIDPEVAFGFPTDESATPTRWRWRRP